MLFNIIVNLIGLVMLTILIFSEKHKKEKSLSAILVVIVTIVIDMIVLIVLYPIYDMYIILVFIILSLVFATRNKLEKNALAIAIMIAIAITISISIFVNYASSIYATLFMNICILILLIKYKEVNPTDKIKTIELWTTIIQIVNIVILIWFMITQLHSWEFKADNKNKYVLCDINYQNEKMVGEQILSPGPIFSVDAYNYYEIDIPKRQVDYRYTGNYIQTFGREKLDDILEKNKNNRILIKTKKLTEQEAQTLKKLLDNYINKKSNSYTYTELEVGEYYLIKGTDIKIEDKQKIDKIIQ